MSNRSRLSVIDCLKQAISATGKSVNAVAKESGVAQAVVQRFVSGKRGIKLDTAERLCAYLKLELGSVLKDRHTVPANVH